MKKAIDVCMGGIIMFLFVYAFGIKVGAGATLLLCAIGCLLVLAEGYANHAVYIREDEKYLTQILSGIEEAMKKEPDPATRGIFRKDKVKYEILLERRRRKGQ